MQQIVSKLPLKIVVRRSTRKLELRPKEFDITDLDEWLETENQDQEMPLSYGSAKANPDQKKSQIQRNRTGSRKPKKNARNETHANSGAKVECLCAKKSNVN